MLFYFFCQIAKYFYLLIGHDDFLSSAFCLTFVSLCVFSEMSSDIDLISGMLVTNSKHYQMITNFPLSWSSLIGRDGIYSSVPRSECTANGVVLCIRSSYF